MTDLMNSMEKKAIVEADAAAAAELQAQALAMNAMSIKAIGDAVGRMSKDKVISSATAMATSEKFDLFIKIGKQHRNGEQLEPPATASSTAGADSSAARSVHGWLPSAP